MPLGMNSNRKRSTKPPRSSLSAPRRTSKSNPCASTFKNGTRVSWSTTKSSSRCMGTDTTLTCRLGVALAVGLVTSLSVALPSCPRMNLRPTGCGANVISNHASPVRLPSAAANSVTLSANPAARTRSRMGSILVGPASKVQTGSRANRAKLMASKPSSEPTSITKRFDARFGSDPRRLRRAWFKRGPLHQRLTSTPTAEPTRPKRESCDSHILRAARSAACARPSDRTHRQGDKAQQPRTLSDTMAIDPSVESMAQFYTIPRPCAALSRHGACCRMSHRSALGTRV